MCQFRKAKNCLSVTCPLARLARWPWWPPRVNHVILGDADDFRSTPMNGPLKLFDHFRGAGEQKMRDCDLAELARVKRVNFPKAICP